MNTKPVFTSTPFVGAVTISTANPNRDGSGSVATLATAGTYGLVIDRIEVCARGTTTAGMVRIFLVLGSNSHLLAEIPVTVATPTASVPTFKAEYVPTTPLALPNAAQLRCSTHNAETFDVIAWGGHLNPI